MSEILRNVNRTHFVKLLHSSILQARKNFRHWNEIVTWVILPKNSTAHARQANCAHDIVNLALYVGKHTTSGHENPAVANC